MENLQKEKNQKKNIKDENVLYIKLFFIFFIFYFHIDPLGSMEEGLSEYSFLGRVR